MPVLFDELAAASETAAATSRRSEKVAAFAEVLGHLAPDEVEAAIAFSMGTTRHGRIGVGWATLSDVRPPPATEPTLTVAEVDRTIAELATMSGSGVVAARRNLLDDVLGRATDREQRLLRGVLGGDLRQGAQEGVLTTAVAAAADVPVAAVRRGAMMAGDLGVAAVAALTGGRRALDAIALRPSRPVQPMLASPATDVAEALDGLDAASVEWKLDGARIQAHRAGDEVRIFTRNLNDVTDRLPGIVELVRSLPAGDLVLDGEAMGVGVDGAPQPFQDTMGDFGADELTGRGSGLSAFFFDAIYAGGAALDEEPLSVRRDVLAATVPASARLPSVVTADPEVADQFLADALAHGHEGVVVKSLDAPYAAGRRGAAWRKVKPVHTFDLVVLAVEWGHGRRRGWLSNLHLGARSPEDGSFVMVGKTFKGLTDELLRWQTERFLGLEIGRGTGRESHVVHVRPEQVVEIAVDGVQRSTRYPGGVALRFARVRRYRDDKQAADADTIDAIRGLLR